EEVARFRLEDVPFTLPSSSSFGRLTREQRLRRVVEDVLVGCGLSEAYHWSLVPADDDPHALRLPEPLGADQAALRTTLRRGLIESARRNLDAGAERIELFEIARVYLPSGEKLPHEPWRVGAIVQGGYPRVKAVVETLYGALKVEPRFEPGSEPFLHPGIAARLDAGWAGELHPGVLDGGWRIFELDLEALFARVPDAVRYNDVITYPAVRQELAFVVDVGVPASDLFDAARAAASPDLREIRFLSDYREPPIPAGKKSIAFAVAFQSAERTLTDSDAAAPRQRGIEALSRQFGAELR